jgi:Na+/H+ antiporter NhaD/arsenite permease-like protein
MSTPVHPALILPFAFLLLLIAAMPLTPPRVKQIWEHYYPHIAISLGLAITAWYLLVFHDIHAVGHALADYVAFISLVGSLFVVAGGIHLNVRGEATPIANVAFLAIGAVVANFIGTTGASMVLIRPWIRMNKIRVSAHHVVFFIFIVSNVGGALTPVGDPPLFIGYLRGVPFFWLVEHVILVWISTVGAILAAFFFFDQRSFARMPRRLQREASEHAETWRFEGSGNVLLLLVIIGAVFVPERFFARELLMVGAAVASWWLTPKVVHEQNHFSFGPIKEVAFLFAGIFLTMLPALHYLEQHAASFGLMHPMQYYFASGSLSAVLDNAPTYANFFELARATTSHGLATTDPAATSALLQQQPLLVVAVSLGSVFFGAMTYIGNGPNFMVKSIAHDAGVHCPSFFAYIAKYSLPILLPILALAGWLFL